MTKIYNLSDIKILNIELNNICNLKCPLCQRNNKETWTKGFRSIAGGCCDGMETVVVVYVQVDKDLLINNVFAEVMHVGVGKFGEGYSEVISNSLFSFDLEKAKDEINNVLGVGGYS